VPQPGCITEDDESGRQDPENPGTVGTVGQRPNCAVQSGRLVEVGSDSGVDDEDTREGEHDAGGCVADHPDSDDERPLATRELVQAQLLRELLQGALDQQRQTHHDDDQHDQPHQPATTVVPHRPRGHGRLLLGLALPGRTGDEAECRGCDGRVHTSLTEAPQPRPFLSALCRGAERGLAQPPYRIRRETEAE